MTSPNQAAADTVETGTDLVDATPACSAVPNRPTGLNGTVNQDRRLVLHWEPQSNANSWQIHELLKDPANTLKATVTTPMSTRGPLAGGRYAYGIIAISANGQSPMSPTIDVHVDPGGGRHGRRPRGRSHRRIDLDRRPLRGHDRQRRECGHLVERAEEDHCGGHRGGPARSDDQRRGRRVRRQRHSDQGR